MCTPNQGFKKQTNTKKNMKKEDTKELNGKPVKDGVSSRMTTMKIPSEAQPPILKPQLSPILVSLSRALKSVRSAEYLAGIFPGVG
jgi:hypothetical protein